MSLPPIPRYVSSGRYAQDLESYSEETPWKDFEMAKAPEEFAETLTGEAKESFATLTEVIRSNRFRGLENFELNFGYDLAADGVEVSFDPEGENLVDRVYPIATDGGGNVSVLMDDGRVLILGEEGLEEHTAFASLDECLWTMVHCHAVKNDKLAFEDVEAVLQKYDEDTGPRFFLEDLEEEMEDR